ncbi:MAG: hypothetical protein JSV62_10565 [Promethearchaeota archaeon]|nr:MAG: hypothetical protein JSV62_10565 [Candidatus Lokiarchaeota archaeon]
MKILYRILKALIILFLTISCFFFLYYFFYFDQHYIWDEIEISINWMVTILFFIIYFYILFFLIDFRAFNAVFLLIVMVGTPVWILIYFLEFLNIEFTFWNWSAIRDLASILCFSVLPPGLSSSFIKYIKSNSNQNKEKRIFRRYRIHEGFVGILFIIIAFSLWIIRLVMIQNETLRRELRIFLALDMIPLILFLFSGSFLTFRDRRDVLKLKFVEKRKIQVTGKSSTIFNPITINSIKFFKSPKFVLFPLGILFFSFGLNMFIHGTDFIIKELFNLSHESIVFLGFLLCFIAGGMIGIDWYRLFGKIYPNLYEEVEHKINEIKMNLDPKIKKL